MKKILLLSSIFAGSLLAASAQNVHIPDPIFKASLLNDHDIDTDHDGEIQVAEAAAYADIIYCRGMNIADFTGLEAFTAITELYCGSNPVNSLDLSHNTALEVVYCDRMQLVYLNVSQNVFLEQLYCFNNELTVLDVSHNTALKYLSCYANQLTALDLSQNPLLIQVNCARNLLTALDVSVHTDLQRLVCSFNRLTSLDLSGNAGLTQFSCGRNLLQSLNLKNGQNTRLNASMIDNPDLVCVQVDDVVYSMTNWADKIDPTAHYSEDCACTASYSSLSASFCPGTTYPAPDGQVFSQSGRYYCQVPSATGCDSIITLTLTEENVPVPIVMVDGAHLSVEDQGWTSYVWYDCGHLPTLPVVGNGQQFTATQDGSYSVRVTTASGCSTMSSCYTVTGNMGTDEADVLSSVSVYPNPATEAVYIGGDVAFSEYRLADALGRVSESHSLQGGSIPVSHLAQGVYHLQLVTSEGKVLIKRIVVAR